MAFKIFTKGNYFYIIDATTGKQFEGLTSEVRVRRLLYTDEKFYFDNVNGWPIQIGITIADIQNENGDQLTSENFVLFYENLNSTDSTNEDYFQNISDGKMSGSYPVNKYGENKAIPKDTTEIIHENGGTYPDFPTTPIISHVWQEADNVNNRGMKVTIIGGDENWNRIEEEITLDLADTTTKIALVTPLIRCPRMKVTDNLIANEKIFCGTLANVKFNMINVNNNQSLMAMDFIPAGKKGFMNDYWADGVESTGKEPKSIEVRLWFADRAKGYEFQLKHSRATSKGQTSINHEFKTPLKITEKTDIKIEATPSGEIGNVKAGFDMIIENE